MEDISLDEYISEFTKLDIENQRSEIINEIKVLIALFQKLNIDRNIKTDLNLNREILDLNKTQVSEKDYLEAVFAYINSLENLIGTYVDSVADSDYE